MAKDPFDSIRFIEDIYRDRERLIGDMSAAQSALKSLDIIAMQKSLNLAAQYEKLLNPAELQVLHTTAFEISNHQFGSNELKSSVSSLLDAMPPLPSYDIMQQVKASFFDAQNNLTPAFFQFASDISAIPKDEAFHTEDDGTISVSPKVVQAISKLLPKVDAKKVIKAFLSFSLMGVISLCYQIKDSKSNDIYQAEMLKLKEREVVAEERQADADEIEAVALQSIAGSLERLETDEDGNVVLNEEYPNSKKE